MKNIKKFVKRKGHHIAAVLVVVLILVTAGVCVSIPVIKVTNKRKASKDVLVSNTILTALMGFLVTVRMQIIHMLN